MFTSCEFVFTPLQKAILQLITATDNLTRQELIQATSSSPQSVMRALQPLIEAGYIAEQSVQTGERGQPNRSVSIIPNKLAIIGLAISSTRASIQVEDINGHELYKVATDLADGKVGTALATAEALLSAAALAMPKQLHYLGLGTTVQGFFIEKSARIVSKGDPVEWSKVNLAEYLQQLTTLPVVIENDARAIASHFLVEQPTMPDTILLLVRSGIGGAIISSGKLLRGNIGNAGEVGMLLPETKYRPTATNIMNQLRITDWQQWHGFEALEPNKRADFESWCAHSAQEMVPAFNAAQALLEINHAIIVSKVPSEIFKYITDRVTVNKLGSDYTTKGLDSSLVADLSFQHKQPIAYAAAGVKSYQLHFYKT